MCIVINKKVETMPSALVDYLQQYTEIKQAILFGSLARGSARMDSDIDLAIDAGHVLTAVERQRWMEGIALVTGRPVDLIDLNSAGQPLLGQVLQHGILIVGDANKYGDLLSRYLLDQADFGIYRQRILDERRQAWIG